MCRDQITLQSAVTGSCLLPPLCGIHKLRSLLLSLPVPTEYPLGKKRSSGHLGKVRKECADHSTPGIYSSRKTGLKESDLTMPREDQDADRSGSHLPFLKNVTAVPLVCPFGFTALLCSPVCLTLAPVGYVHLACTWRPSSTGFCCLRFCFGVVPFDNLTTDT